MSGSYFLIDVAQWTPWILWIQIKLGSMQNVVVCLWSWSQNSADGLHYVQDNEETNHIFWWFFLDPFYTSSSWGVSALEYASCWPTVTCRFIIAVSTFIDWWQDDSWTTSENTWLRLQYRRPNISCGLPFRTKFLGWPGLCYNRMKQSNEGLGCPVGLVVPTITKRGWGSGLA